jgi:hypothetical protein
LGINAADEVIFLGGGWLQMGTGGLAHFSCSSVPRKQRAESCTKAGSIEVDDVRSDRRSLKEGGRHEPRLV